MKGCTITLLIVVVTIAGIALAVRTNNQEALLQKSSERLSLVEKEFAAGDLNRANSQLIQLEIDSNGIDKFYTWPSVKQLYKEVIARKESIQIKLKTRITAIREVIETATALAKTGKFDQAQETVKTGLTEVGEKDPSLFVLARYVDSLKHQDFTQASEAIAKLKGSLPEELNVSAIANLLSGLVNSEGKANRDSQSNIATQVRSLVRLDGAQDLAEFKPVLKDRAMVWDFTKKNIDQAYELLPENLRGSARDDVITMFTIVSRQHVLIGHYSVSGQPGYKEEMKIGVVYWPDKISPGTGVISDDPPHMRPVQHVPGYGSIQIKEWIERLPRQ